ncbi:hypothetical protein SAMN05421803_14324 [Nocardiopsis flavescens]|uniref:Uncharacterized protein n=1 Tax=Nocardiopsis flavescens TaxID=758803 RepID=A0A1M6WGE7_9ACTN|nr:hypothetical protein [Nocardiopsis flavescens]SHK92758.1 hypothetical protein SAMN05421803_14324 [Nocardiopsis flavescens]
MSTFMPERPVDTDAEPETTPAAPVRPMPTKADAPEIRAIAEAYSGDCMIDEVTTTSGGTLVRYDRRFGKSPAPALEAVGYTTVDLRKGLLLVTGAVDQVARLEAQISALRAERERLLEQQTGAPF